MTSAVAVERGPLVCATEGWVELSLGSPGVVPRCEHTGATPLPDGGAAEARRSATEPITIEDGHELEIFESESDLSKQQ